MLPYLSLGPLLLQTPGFILLLSGWISLTLIEKEAQRLKLNQALVYNLVFWGLVAGIIGARLAYAARYLNIYLDDPLSLVALNFNTLSPQGGLIIGLLAAAIYGWRVQLPLRTTLDALAPGLAAFMIAWGIAHLLSGAAFGSPTDLPWAIYLWEANRHPTQIYEIVLAIAVFLVVRKRPLDRPGTGLNFLLTVALLSSSRLFLEAFRGDSLLWVDGIRTAQVVSLGILLICLWLIKASILPPHKK
ncbi:MAG: prolipoprotein diacylglyceryl transferase [Anaerolineae bacterium]|nr:prolipoprotein diacylglyceryl transferase [Anaerolineae bacterium]